MTACAFVIPGDIGLPTGGYAYDRRVLALLGQYGVAVSHLALPGSFPAPTASDLAVTERTLAALPVTTVLLFDGLAYGALPADLIERIRQPIVALCHHPLALETGVAPDRARELAALERAALAHARHVVVSSPATRATLAADFGVALDRVTVAEPGTDRASRAAPWSSGPLRLLAVGSLIPRKGYDYLIAALADLPREPGMPAWALEIAGSKTLDAETAAALARQISDCGLADRIGLLGAVTAEALDRHYAASHLFVMPSLYEGYGMVLAEAMVRGLPIVCTTGGAAADLVPDTAGIKVPPGDAVALKMALQRVLTQPGVLADLAAGSWVAGQKLPRWEDTARIIADVIKQVST